MRTKAIENAKARAIALTSPLNQALGAAIHIADGENYNTNNVLQGRAAGLVVTGYKLDKNAKHELPSIEFEKIKVTTNINVKFKLL